MDDELQQGLVLTPTYSVQIEKNTKGFNFTVKVSNEPDKNRAVSDALNMVHDLREYLEEYDAPPLKVTE